MKKMVWMILVMMRLIAKGGRRVRKGFYTAIRQVSGVALVTMLLVSPVFAQKDAPADETHKVTRIVDGDTIVVDGNVKVRLIGVDTPEYHPSDKLRRDSIRSDKDVKTIIALGKKATQFTKREIDGQKVRLEYGFEKKDKYGRTLAYVFRESDNFFLNAEIIKQGYGHAYTRFPFEYMEQFRGYEKEAREQQKGLWADNSLEGLGGTKKE